MQQTFVMCKPDAVERGLVGEIIGRFEAKGLKLGRAELRTIDRDTAARHYAEHQGKPFFDDLLDFVTRGPSLLMVVEGSEECGDEVFSIVRTMMGATNPAKAAPGTIRGDFGTLMTENLVHGSDSAESARREIEIFFSA